jgi:hypothetical protein
VLGPQSTHSGPRQSGLAFPEAVGQRVVVVRCGRLRTNSKFASDPITLIERVRRQMCDGGGVDTDAAFELSAGCDAASKASKRTHSKNRRDAKTEDATPQPSEVELRGAQHSV